MKLAVLLSCAILILTPLTVSSETYQLIFPKSSGFPYAKLYGSINHQLEEFTLCYWTRSADQDLGVIFSYSTPNLNDAIVTKTSGTGLYQFIQNNVITPISIEKYTEHWYHTCITSTTLLQRTWAIYINGYSVQSGKLDKAQNPIPANGIVVLGQNAESKDGEFINSEKYEGQVADLFLWDRILKPDQIAQVYNCTFAEQANVINWHLHTWEFYNDVRISSVILPCGQK